MLTLQVRSCEIRLSFSCFALLAFFCLFAGNAGSAFFCLAVLLHEMAHIAVLCILHVPPQRITLSALGCQLVPYASHPLSCSQSALVSVAAPLCNLAVGLIALPFLRQAHPFVAANLSLGFFHALPVEPLDGGLCLHSLLSLWFSPRAARTITVICSLAVLLPLSILGFLVLLQSHYNFSLLAMSLYLMLYLLLGEGLTPA